MEGNLKKCFVAVLCIAAVVAKPSKLDRSEQTQLGFLDGDTGETDWFKTAQKEMMDSIDETLRITSRINQAKNIILFIGDGMGISTVTAARIYHAQSRQLVGDDVNLSFEKFPYVALSKTYNTDKQVGDSAATATAFTCGVKAKYGTLGVNQLVYRKNCTNTMENAVPSFIKYAMDDGKWTGVVSTTRVTHATPAATYAHSGERNWESDADVAREVEDPEDREQCKDIAYQLVHTEHNRDIRVILGGGRSKFMRSNQTDPEYPGQMGDREDTDLVNDWLEYKRQQFPDDENKYKYVVDQEGFDAADEEEVEYLFGMFEPGHMRYEMERENEPSLAEMTAKAINILKRGPDGFALIVEGGRIDHAHHATYVSNALNETLAFADAVKEAVDLTDESDTLIVVSADHSHSIAMNGDPYISSDILGLVHIEDSDHNNLVLQKMGDDKPYTGMMYTNGPGWAYHRLDENDTEVSRRDLTDDPEIGQPNYEYDSAMYVSSETHAGEEVAIYARGPMSHLFHGTHEQNYIAHVLMYAACIGPNIDHCDKPRAFPFCADSVTSGHSVSYSLMLFAAFVAFIIKSFH